jgi:hypothetical protein
MSGDPHDLLRWCALATRNEPELVRSFRLQLQRELDVDAEADVWWSPAVEERSTSGVVLRTDVATSCRAELRALHVAGDPRPRQAWALVQAAHIGTSPAIQLEEQINWLAVSEDEPGAAIESSLRRALAAVVNEDRQGLVQWAARALPRMPAIATDQPSAWYLEQGARTQMPAGASLTRAPAHIDEDVILRLSRHLPTSVLGVLRLGPTLLLGDVGPGGEAISVARTDPRVVEVIWPREFAPPDERGQGDGIERHETIRVPAGTRQEVQVGWDPITVRTSAGQEYDLPPDDGLPTGLAAGAIVVVTVPARLVQGGFVVAPDLVVSLAFDSSESPVVQFPNSGRTVPASVVRQVGQLALLSLQGMDDPSAARLPVRRLRRPPSAGRRWYSWGPLGSSLRGADEVASGRSATDLQDLLVGVVDSSLAPGGPDASERGSRSQVDLRLSTAMPLPPEPLGGGPVIVDGEIAGVVVGRSSEGGGSYLLGDWRSLWALLRPDSADATPQQWLDALVDAAQMLALEYHSGLDGNRVPIRDVVTDAQREELRSQAEWMVRAAVADQHPPEDDATDSTEKWHDALTRLVDLRTPRFRADDTMPRYVAGLLHHIEDEYVIAATLQPNAPYQGGYGLAPETARRLSLSSVSPSISLDPERNGAVTGRLADIAQLFHWVVAELLDALEDGALPTSEAASAAGPAATPRPTAAAPPPTPRVGDAPEIVDWTSKVAEWPMFTTDRLGASTCAAIGHLILAWSAETLGRPADLTDDDIVAAYSALNGYDPTDGSSDRGAAMIDAVRLWRRDGVGGHKIAAYKAVPPDDPDIVRRALWLFGGLYLGFMLHRGGLDDFTEGRPWTDVDEVDVAGGHAVAVVGCDAEFLTVVSWSRLHRMSWPYLRARCHDMYAVASHDWVGPDGATPSGLSWTELRAQLRKIGPARPTPTKASDEAPQTTAEPEPVEATEEDEPPSEPSSEPTTRPTARKRAPARKRTPRKR